MTTKLKFQTALILLALLGAYIYAFGQHCPLCPDSYFHSCFNDNDRTNIRGNMPDTVKSIQSFSDLVWDIEVELEELADSMDMTAPTMEYVHYGIEVRYGNIYLTSLRGDDYFSINTVEDYLIMRFQWEEWQTGNIHHYDVEIAESNILRAYIVLETMYHQDLGPEWLIDHSGLETGDVSSFIQNTPKQRGGDNG